MIVRPPNLDTRRASELYQELARVARAVLPGWRPARDQGDLAEALWQIAARLGEHVAQRVQQTPRRDAIAFYDLLDVPAEAARPAVVPVAFLLAENLRRAVTAPQGTQAAAQSGADELIFETAAAAQLTPARLKALVATDSAADHIEEAPLGFLELVRSQAPLPDFRVVSFAAAGSRRLQIEPAEGLAPGDLVRIDNGQAYTLAAGQDGLFTLTANLEQDVNHNAKVQKIIDFAAFTLPNLQEHAVYLGHAELLNLKGSAELTLRFAPDAVADQLTEVDWQLYGTPDNGEPAQTADWQSLRTVSSSGGVIVLSKDWLGAADQLKVNGQGSRWLRGKYRVAIAAANIAGTRTEEIRLGVRTTQAGTARQAPSDGCAGCPEAVGAAAPPPAVDGPRAASNDSTDSTDTISKAFHNATPLPLTTPFLPFGPEPLRFDTFALAAPEAFSKKGALARLEVTLADATLVSMAVARIVHGPPRIYGLSTNGRLQGIVVTGTGSARWREFDHPPRAKAANADNLTARDVELRSDSLLQAVQIDYSAQRDLIVAEDRRGGLWGVQLTTDGDGVQVIHEWTEFPALPQDLEHGSFVVLRHAGAQPGAAAGALLLTSAVGALYGLELTIQGPLVAASAWRPMTSGSKPIPSLGLKSRLVPVQPFASPMQPMDSTRFVALDQDGALWRGTFDSAYSKVHWDRLASGETFALDVVPVAAETSHDELVVLAARPGQPARPDSRVPVAIGLNGILADNAYVSLASDSVITGVVVPVVGQMRGIARGSDNMFHELILHEGALTATRIEIPQDSTPSSPLTGSILLRDDAPALLFGYESELIRHKRSAESVQAKYYDALEIKTTDGAPDYVGLPGSEQSELISIEKNLVIESHTDSDPHVYWLPAGTIAKNEKLSAYRINQPFTGKRVEDNDSQLEMDHGDDLTKPLDYLAIGGARYRVVAKNEKILDLNGTLPSGSDPITYHLLAYLGELEVKEGNASTLLSFSKSSMERHDLLRFVKAKPTLKKPDPTPAIQLIDRMNAIAGVMWVKLVNGWQAAPIQTTLIERMTAVAGAWSSVVFDRKFQNPALAWEYYDGEGWRSLESIVDRTENLAKSGDVTFTVPADLAPGEVAGQQDYWIRARLIGGDYGRPEYRITTEPNPDFAATPSASNTIQTVTIDTSKLHPPEIRRIHATFDQAASPPEHIVVYNNLTYRVQSDANRTPHAEFELFEGIRKINGAGSPRVIYFGFSQPFDVSLAMFVDAADRSEKVILDFEVLGADDWHSVTADDQTHGFHRRGFAYIQVDVVPRLAWLFGRDRYWMRARPRFAASSWSPHLRGVFLNAALAHQAETIRQEVLGSSLGAPNLRLRLSRKPVLANSLELRIRETLSSEELEALAATELRNAAPTVARFPELSLPGDWILWHAVDSFGGRGLDERVYRLDAQTGEVQFGPNTKAPPAGTDNIRAIRYQTGGGIRGNIRAYTASSLKSSVEGVESVTNPVAASGGTDAPTDPGALLNSAGARICRRGQALTPSDIESLLVASSPLIVRARCLPPDRPGGALQVAVAMRNGTRCPQPSLSDLEGLAALLRSMGWEGLPENAIRVFGPRYVRMGVTVRVRPRTSADAAALEIAATNRLRRLLDPLAGGRHDDGWPFGERIWPSDIFRALAQVDACDGIDELVRFEPVDPDHDLDRMDPFGLIGAEDNDVQVMVAVRGPVP